MAEQHWDVKDYTGLAGFVVLLGLQVAGVVGWIFRRGKQRAEEVGAVEVLRTDVGRLQGQHVSLGERVETNNAACHARIDGALKEVGEVKEMLGVVEGKIDVVIRLLGARG